MKIDEVESVAARAVKIVAPFLAAAIGWVVFSDFELLRLVDASRFRAVEFALDSAFVVAIVYALYRTIRRILAKAASAVGRLEDNARVQRMVIECERAVWRARKRDELLQEFCRLAVEIGGYKLAWYGSGLRDERKTVRLAASAGADDGYLDAIDLVWSATPRGLGPTGTAIRTGSTQICRATSDDPRVAPWAREMAKRGYRSSAAFPVREGHERGGALTLYSGRTDAFDAAELELMERVTNSLSYALEHFDKVEAEAKLFEELKVLAHAVDSSPVSVVITDRDGNIEFVNRKFCELTGYGADEARGKNPRILKTGETPPEEYRRLWETITSGRDWRGVLHNRRKDGSTYWESAMISPVYGAEGRIIRFIAVKEDITEKRSLEQQLQQAQKMESLGVLAGGVAHDFNNLLTVIQGHCELMDAALPAGSAARESIAEIRAASDRAAAMTRRLLHFGRRQPMNSQRVDLRVLVWDVVRMLKRLAGENHPVEILRPPLPVWANVDPAMIELLLMNLVLNARDAMPSGGPITVSLARAPDDALVPSCVRPCPDGYVLLSVTDRGGGIAPENLARVFEPFFTTKGPERGTGLGLAVVDGIVRQHEGWIRVESEVGRGSTFSVRLPATSAVAAAAAQPDPSPLAAGRDAGSILLVEDDAPLRDVLARSLRADGYDVVEASKGGDAVLKWETRQAPFDLLVTDMTMPGGMTGVELARRFRADVPGLRVIVISGYHPDLPTDSMKVGDDFDFLPKPFKPGDLIAKARETLDGV